MFDWDLNTPLIKKLLFKFDPPTHNFGHFSILYMQVLQLKKSVESIIILQLLWVLMQY